MREAIENILESITKHNDLILDLSNRLHSTSNELTRALYRIEKLEKVLEDQKPIIDERPAHQRAFEDGDTLEPIYLADDYVPPPKIWETLGDLIREKQGTPVHDSLQYVFDKDDDPPSQEQLEAMIGEEIEIHGHPFIVEEVIDERDEVVEEDVEVERQKRTEEIEKNIKEAKQRAEMFLGTKLGRGIVDEHIPYPTQQEREDFADGKTDLGGLDWHEYDTREDELVHRIHIRTVKEILEHPDFIVLTSKMTATTLESIMWQIWREEV